MKYMFFPFIPYRASTLLPSLLLSLFVLNFTSVQGAMNSIVGYTCDNSSTFTDSSNYSTNLDLVINDLAHNAPQSSGFNTSSHGQSPNKVYGLLQCTGNISAVRCLECVLEANNSIHELCANDIGGRIWLDDCFLRYHNSNFISILDTTGVTLLNWNIITGDAFKSTTSSLLSNISDKAYIPASKGFATGSSNYSASGMLYGLVQCWRDISIQDCRSCLVTARTSVNNCCSTNQGAQVQYGSCKVIYDTHLFFDTAQSPSPSPDTVNRTPSTTSKKKSSKTLPILLGLMGGIILAFVLCLIAFRKKVKFVIFERPITIATQNQERHGFSSESGLLMQDQQFVFSLEMLAEATENFHHKNKLGEGGFGVVYKETTRDGNEIAVKSLSAKSAQDLEKRRELDWQKRYNIIIGIARGLLYLHQDSQLRIIHRDIKANNILLDHKLNPKIADFGLARLFPEDKTHIHTGVAGTYGYMAPEYAMRGQLSVKVDVYSFGVVLLEIISGRKNNDHHLPYEMQNLLEWAWKLFKGGNALDMVDSKAPEVSHEQALRCIHVGLLCVQADATLRPAMSNVILMISSSSVALPNPSNPAFVSNSESHASMSKSKSKSKSISINETSLTETEAR